MKYDLKPKLRIPNIDKSQIGIGYTNFARMIDGLTRTAKSLSLDLYGGINHKLYVESAKKSFEPDLVISTTELLKDESEFVEIISKHMTDDPVFGVVSEHELQDFFDNTKVNDAKDKIRRLKGKVLVYGLGASLIYNCDKKVYIDATREELTENFGKNCGNWLTIHKCSLDQKYKAGFFIDWRALDPHKFRLQKAIDLYVANNYDNPVSITGDVYRECLDYHLTRPFKFKPTFSEGVWGGQWMKSQYDLPKDVRNYAWANICSPEQNSFIVFVNGIDFEIPAVNLINYESEKFLGERTLQTFGANMPIRVTLLDTVEGSNLSIQVHPDNSYIKESFNMFMGQDESYYVLDSTEDAQVCLGKKDEVTIQELIDALQDAHYNGKKFIPEKYLHIVKSKKHDHFIIPAGTIHAQMRGNMILEISANPYIYTFKLWDWDRLGLDGKPRPIHLDHGSHMLNKSKSAIEATEQLINKISIMSKGDNYIEERTGLHDLSKIETRRFKFSGSVSHTTNESVNTLTLVEGDEIIIRSVDNNFDDYQVKYSETVVIPAAVGGFKTYSVNGTSVIVKAFIK